MLLRFRLARWHADETKAKDLADILTNPILAEAIDIVAAESRDEYLALRGTAPSEFLARREIESGAISKLLASLAVLASPPPQPFLQTQEWQHLEDPPPTNTP